VAGEEEFFIVKKFMNEIISATKKGYQIQKKDVNRLEVNIS
jgi:hypothetical protein